MSDSYPTIQESLSPMEREFLGCVEMHLDPPEDDALSYEVEALYRFADEDRPLPGEVVRFKLVVNEDADEDLSERRHIVEFLDSAAGAPIARLSHSMKRVEASQGKYFWTESRFRVLGPDVPDEQAPYGEVEREVELYLERIREVDRRRQLQPLDPQAEAALPRAPESQADGPAPSPCEPAPRPVERLRGATTKVRRLARQLLQQAVDDRRLRRR